MNEKWQEHFQGAMALVGEEKFADAVVQLSQALVEAPDEYVAQCYATRGYAQLCARRFEQAIDDCNLAIEHDATDGEAFAWRGSANAELKQWRPAIDDYLQAIALSPEKHEEYRDILDVHLRAAIEDFTRKIRAGGATADVYRDRGLALALRNDHEAAVRDLTQALQLDASSAEAHLCRAESLVALKQFDKAIGDCTRAIRLGEAGSHVYLARAKALRETGQFDRAVSDLTRVIQLEPNLAEAFYERGLAQQRRNAGEAAVGDFTRAIKLDANFADAYVARARAHSSRGKYESAANDLARALELRPGDPELLTARGDVYLKLRHAAPALEDFEAVLAQDAVNARAFRGRGIALAQQQDHTAAITELTKAIRLDARDDQAYEARGDVYLEQQDYERAAADYTKVIDLARDRSNLSSIYNRRGIANLDRGEYTAAVDDLDEAIAKNPLDADAYAWRAAALGELRQFREALDSVMKAIELAPARAEEYRQIGHTASERAIPALTAAIAADPQNSSLYRDRAVAYEFQQAGNEALADYNLAIQLSPGDRDTIFRRGAVLWRGGKFERALADFTQAIELGDQRAVCRHHRGVCHARMGKLAEALSDLNKAIELDPTDPRAYRDRAEILAAGGKHELAEADFSRAIKRNSGDARAFFGRGYLLHLARKYDDAIRDFTAAIQRDPTHAMAHFRRGEALVCIGKLPAGINDFDAAIRLDENLVAAYCSRGLAVAKAGRQQRAVIELSKAGGRIRFDLRFAIAFENRGRVYYSMGQYERAVQDYDFVLELNPPGHNLTQTHYGRALALFQLGDRKGSERALRLALRLSPKHTDTRTVLSWIAKGCQGSIMALRRPASVIPIARPPIAIPPVPMDRHSDEWNVEPIWDQWLVHNEDGREYGPVTKAALDAWCAEGRLGPKSLLLRIDWDQWVWGTEIYQELAMVTHRTANRPIPIQPTPLVPAGFEDVSAGGVDNYSAAAEEQPSGEGGAEESPFSSIVIKP
jgi:tetratricopeptide (TPR) repeat protein